MNNKYNKFDYILGLAIFVALIVSIFYGTIPAILDVYVAGPQLEERVTEIEKHLSRVEDEEAKTREIAWDALISAHSVGGATTIIRITPIRTSE